jgi:2-polyprenyl-3-methyl-5-hydroxy-6-metoxy-1,4-benzoquinol methylase
MAELSKYSHHAYVPDTSNDSWSNMFGFIPDGSRVLDVGCATGNFGQALEQHKGCTVVGVDINDADIEIARSRITEAHVLDISDPAAVETIGTFDVVVFGDVIEHLVDPRAVLRSVQALLKEGGRVVYSIPHMGHVSVRLDMLDGRFPYTEIGLLDRTHLHFYDRVEVQRVFADAGFAIVAENPTTAVYPDRWIAGRLAGIGLTAGPAFFEMLAATESHVFQYVGVAVTRGDSAVAPREVGEELMPQDQLARRTEELMVENDRMRAELNELHERVVRLRSHPVAGMVHEVRRRFRR